MSVTESVRARHTSRAAAIDDSASDYREELAEQQALVAAENARNSIIAGFDPKTGATLTLDEHKRRLDEIEAWGSELDIYYLRREREAESRYEGEPSLDDYDLMSSFVW